MLSFYIMKTVSIQEKDIILVNIYASRIGTPKYIKQILINIKREIDGNIITLGDFTHWINGRYFREEISKAREWHNGTVKLNWHLQDTICKTTQQQTHNTHSFHVHYHSLGQTTH